LEYQNPEKNTIFPDRHQHKRLLLIDLMGDQQNSLTHLHDALHILIFTILYLNLKNAKYYLDSAFFRQSPQLLLLVAEDERVALCVEDTVNTKTTIRSFSMECLSSQE
jgi:hypothetical protein